MLLNGDGVEQQPWRAVDGDAVPADESGVPRVETDIVLGRHRGVGLADEELSVVVDG